MRNFISHFWVCLGIALFCSVQAAASYAAEDGIVWAWVMGICALFWLNDAKRALNRDKEANDEQDRTPEG